MTDPDPGYEFLQTTLEQYPDVAQAVGRYHAAFAILEHELYIVFSIVLRTDVAGALALLSHIQSFSLKLQAIQSFIPHARLTEYANTTCKHILNIAGACNSFRNKLAHGQFGITPAGELMLCPYSTSGGRQSKEEPINAKKINDYREKDIERARALINILIKTQPIPAGFV